MTFEEYQTRSQILRLPSARQAPFIYPLLGLVGETGEVSEKIKKTIRDGKDVVREDIVKELGDILWYLTALGEDFGISLIEIAKANVEKLESRAQRGVISGSGDNR